MTVNSETIKKIAAERMIFIEEQGLQDKYNDWLQRKVDEETSRPKAQSYVDGDEIRVNITDCNCSILLSFMSVNDFEDFCAEVKNLGV